MQEYLGSLNNFNGGEVGEETTIYTPPCQGRHHLESMKQAVSKEERVLTGTVTGWVTHGLWAGLTLVSIDKPRGEGAPGFTATCQGMHHV